MARRKHERMSPDKKNLIASLIDMYDIQTADDIRDISYYHESNIFGNVEKYFVYGNNESIHYYVYESEYSGILDKVWDDIIHGRRYNEDAVDCTEDWEAKKALRNKLGIYYVRLENAILEFSDYEDVYLSEEQIDIILKKLELR